MILIGGTKENNNIYIIKIYYFDIYNYYIHSKCHTILDYNEQYINSSALYLQELGVGVATLGPGMILAPGGGAVGELPP